MNAELVEKYTLALTRLKKLGAFDILPEYETFDFYYEVYWSKFFQLDYSSIISELDEFETSVLKKLQGMFSMWLSSERGDCVYRPMYVLSDGRRSFSLEDLDNEFLQALYNQVESLFTQSIILSRLYDIIWVRKGIEQKSLYEAGKKAFQYYHMFCEELLNVKNYYVASTIVLRLRMLAFGLGRNFKGRENYCDYILKFLDYSVSDDTLFFLYQVWKIIFEIRWGEDESRILTQLSQVVEKCVNDTNLSWRENLTELLVKIYGRLKLPEKQKDILEDIAKFYINKANALEKSFSKITFLSKAIEAYRRIKGNPDKEIIAKLYIQIQGLQKQGDDLFHSSKYRIDVTEDVQKFLAYYRDKGFVECMVGFWWCKDNLPTEKAIQDELKQGYQSPFLGTISTVIVDHLGQTVSVNNKNVQEDISLDIYYSFIVDMRIIPMIQLINEKFYIEEKYIVEFFHFNPFVPAGYEALFAKGIYYFLKQKFIEAATILIPLVENSLRHVLSENQPTIYKKNDEEIFSNKIRIDELIGLVQKENLLDATLLFHLKELVSNSRYNVRNYIAHGLYPEEMFYTKHIIVLLFIIFVLSLDRVYNYEDI